MAGRQDDAFDALAAIERLAAGERVKLGSDRPRIPTMARGNRARHDNGIPMGGVFGQIINEANLSESLRQSEMDRLKQGSPGDDDYTAMLKQLSAKLIEKYEITPPDVVPNTIANGWRTDLQSNITAVGMTADDPRNPRTWGWLQRDRTFHTHIIGGTGSGKSLPRLTFVLTETGWRHIGDLEVGDKVYTRDGRLAPVKGVFDRGSLPVYEVEFEDHTVVECSGDHLWYDMRNSHGMMKEFVKTTSEMLDEGIRSHWNSERGCYTAFRHHVPLCMPIEWPEQKLPIHPYVIGCLLGDGCTVTSPIEFSSADEELVERFNQCLGDDYRLVDRRTEASPYKWALKPTQKGQPSSHRRDIPVIITSLGINCRAEHKFIPDIYKFSGIEQRIELVRGLMDTDGTASKGRFRYCSVSKQLRDDLAEVLRSLGLIVYLGEDHREGKYERTGNTAYTLQVSSDDVDMLFSLSRKRKDYEDYVGNKSMGAVRSNERTEPIRYDDGPSDNDLPFPPYAVGVFLCSRIGTNGVFATSSSEFSRNRISGLFPGNDATWSHMKNGHQKDGTPIMTWKFDVDGGRQRNGRHLNLALHALRALGMDCRQAQRLIPDAYMHASIQARQDLLQGILDANGAFCDQTIEFYAKNPVLAQQVCDLAASLGYVADVSATKNSVTNTVTIRVADAEMASDPEKVAYIESILGRCGDTRRIERDASLAIVDIRRTDRFEEMRCITVDDPSQSFILEGYVVTHNSTLLANLIVDDAWYRRGSLLIDPHGDLASQCLEAMPPYMMDKVVYLDVLDPDYSPGFNPLEFPPNATEAERQEAVSSVVALMQKHFGVDAGMARLVKNLENALQVLSYVPGATILDIKDFFDFEEVRTTCLQFMPDGTEKKAISSAMENIKQDETASLMNRLSRFQNNRFLKQLFGQSHTTVDLYSLMNQGAVVLCPIKKGATADDVFVKFYGSYIVSTIYKNALRRESIPENSRIIFPLILDEFQNFVTGDIENMLAELRKYGLAMVLAHQYLDQISGGVASAMDNSCKNKLVYTMNANDAPRMARNFPGITPQDLQAIPKYHIMASVFHKGGSLTPFLSRTFGPISGIPGLSDAVAKAIVENSHRHYMKARDAIDAEISERHDVLSSGNKEAVIKFANRMRTRADVS